MEQRTAQGVLNFQRPEDTQAVPSGLPNVTVKMEKEEDGERRKDENHEVFCDAYSGFPEEMRKVKEEEQLWDHQTVEENKTLPTACSEFPFVEVKMEEEENPLVSDAQAYEEGFPDVTMKVEPEEDLQAEATAPVSGVHSDLRGLYEAWSEEEWRGVGERERFGASLSCLENAGVSFSYSSLPLESACGVMAPKKPAESRKRKREQILLEVKQDIIRKHEQGMRVVDLAREYGRGASTIATILKDKKRIMGREAAKGVTVLTKNRPAIMDKVEKLLLLWIRLKERAGDSVTSAVVCAKAKALHADLIAQQPGTSSQEDFKASKGWFQKFKRRSGIRNVVRHGEAASSDLDAAEEFAMDFLETVTAEGYLPEQVFNCDETSLFWKRMPRRTFITIEETKMPGYKPMKDRLTLLFCANARGDLKVKPLLVYHSENPRAFKKHKVNKESLNVMWRSNAKGWVTRVLFVDWVNQVFGPTVRRYLQEKNLPLKAILLMDNVPAHPPGLEEDLAEEFKFIRVIFQPPNTIPLIKPMDQQLIANFKKLYTRELFRHLLNMTAGSGITLTDCWKHHFNIVSCLQLIKIAWDSVSQRNLNSCWKNLWGACVASTESSTQEEAVVEEIVSLGQIMGLEVSTQDVEELVEEHNLELSTEDLLSLQEQEQQGMHPNTPEKWKEEPRPLSSYKRAFKLWRELQTFANNLSEDQAATQEAVKHFDNVVVAPWRAMLHKRQRQQTMDWFVVKQASQEKEPCCSS